MDGVGGVQVFTLYSYKRFDRIIRENETMVNRNYRVNASRLGFNMYWEIVERRLFH